MGRTAGGIHGQGAEVWQMKSNISLRGPTRDFIVLLVIRDSFFTSLWGLCNALQASHGKPSLHCSTEESRPIILHQTFFDKSP